MPNIIVTDFSWALIHSVIQTFNNNCSILSYLNWTFDVIISGKSANQLIVNTRIFICAGHFLKIIIKKAKKVIVAEKTRKVFIFSFSLLQNCVSVAQFNDLLYHVFNLFNTKNNNDSCLHSFQTIRNEVAIRGLQSTQVNEINDKASLDKEAIIENLDSKYFLLSPQETTINLKAESPYTLYFGYILDSYKKIVEAHQSGDVDNQFYSPDLFKIIVDYLHIFSFWNGSIISEILLKHSNYKIQTRLTNNPVENYFGHLKKNLLKYRKHMPSSLTAVLYDRLKIKYIQHYIDNTAPMETDQGKNYFNT